MRHKKIAKKWRLISLAKQIEEGIAYEFLRRALNLKEASKILNEIAFECGEREREKIRRALGTEDPVDLVETILMLSGVKYKVGEHIEIYDCFLPAYGCIPMKSACEAFLEGVSPKIKIREGICEKKGRCIILVP